MSFSPTVKLAIELISQPSITPNDAQCQQIIVRELSKLGFNSEFLPFGDVQNIWIKRGNRAPLFVFAGHTDVVPTGPLTSWKSDPFKPEIRDNHLFGRGAADMKGSIAAMLTACRRFIEKHPNHDGSIAFLITSDEEGPALDGTVKVIETLSKRNEKIDWCIVGEPSSSKSLGDMIKIGRRGSLNGTLILHGVQGHIAYPHFAQNPIHMFSPILNDIVQHEWDQGNDAFPPTSFQISNLNSGTGAVNVIPADIHCVFNFRYSTEVTYEQLAKEFEKIVKKHTVPYTLNWSHSGKPFLTSGGSFVDKVCSAIKEITGIDTERSTSGGTSDGRFIAPSGAQVVELGPLNETIHKIDECVDIQDLDTLSEIYEQVLINLLA